MVGQLSVVVGGQVVFEVFVVGGDVHITTYNPNRQGEDGVRVSTSGVTSGDFASGELAWPWKLVLNT